MKTRIDSFLSARLHLSPQIVGERIYFISNLSGRLSLYAMFYGGSVPEPLLPPEIAMQNPDLVGGHPFFVFPLLDRVLVMLDRDGDENYQPMLIPIEGGYPEPAFEGYFKNYRVHLGECDLQRNLVYLSAESRSGTTSETYRGDLRSGKLEKLAESEFNAYPVFPNQDHSQAVFSDQYMQGDGILYDFPGGKRRILLGKPLESRKPDEVLPSCGILSAEFLLEARALLLVTAYFDDQFSLARLDLSKPGELQPVKIEGLVHKGMGELLTLKHLQGSHYGLLYNIDGCSWLYEGIYNDEKMLMSLRHVLVGQGDLAGGVLLEYSYDHAVDRFAFSFSTATNPTQIYTVEGKQRDTVVVHTDERLLGIPESQLSTGEDASFDSYDGTRISARLYLPNENLEYKGLRPLVYYLHGGPQSQERPDFSWFSMPLIQYLTLQGFAVFVPNVRGSTGYGLSFTRQVDHDWGGRDRLDHVHAMTKVLPKDSRLDLKHSGVVGRSYGGYMTLTLAGRHPDLWSAAVDMFGPYDLVTFSERIPETWKPYFKVSLADSTTTEGRAFLKDRSPSIYLDHLSCPMLVIQGRRDPRVVASESENLVNDLKKKGKNIDLLVFEDEGHDVLKIGNRITCYNAITDFFKKHLVK